MESVKMHKMSGKLIPELDSWRAYTCNKISSAAVAKILLEQLTLDVKFNKINVKL